MTDQPLQYAAATDTGLRRSHNEDCYAAEPGLGLWLVADGVGGHSAGEVASDIVRHTMRARVMAGDSLERAIGHSHRAVLDAMRARTDTLGMGSTVVALRLAGCRYEIAWVGDSRAYLYNGQLTCLTTDHTQVAELLAQRRISRDEARRHPRRNVLTQSLGVAEDMSPRPGCIRGTLGPGEILLLCSDGLTDELSDRRIAALMATSQTPRGQVDALIQGALHEGGSDNVTVVAVGDYRRETPVPADRTRTMPGCA